MGIGTKHPLPRGTAADLEDRLHQHFSRHSPETVVAGAFPFDRGRNDYLLSMTGLTRDPPDGPVPGQSGHFRALGPEPAPERFRQSVEQALRRIDAEGAQQDGLRKVVLARSFLAQSDEPIDPAAVLARLAGDPAVMAFQIPLPDRDGQARHLVGASPELLIARNGPAIRSHPLAGSARRHSDPAQDARAAEDLRRSAKDRREHAFLVEYILDILAPYCRQLTAPEGTVLTSTRTMWHLGTRIEGRLRDPEMSSALLAARLHPTPAVCGVPQQSAMKLIGELETVDRDFYAGAVGWCDGRGDGAWHVAIRCAEICGTQARLYAGAGIVAGSDPQSEAEETGAKFAAMLAAFGLPDSAGLPDAAQDGKSAF